jgi:hypothetical protein
MGRLRPHPNTTPPVVRSGEAQDGQISALFEVPFNSARSPNAAAAQRLRGQLPVARLVVPGKSS